MEEKSRVAEQMPATIGRYQVQESIGYGAMGAVYKAFDPLIKRTLAIKTIRLDIPRGSPQYKSFIERFYHEARISGTLSHPNIVTLFDIGEETGLPYLAMEFVEGETISSLLEKGHRFKPEKVINLVSQIASAVDYAHSKGVIHRDIKPSNVILYEGDRVKVTDFGIAKLADSDMTQSGTLLGTPAYMSPEQAMGEKLDGRSDIFSLGVCAFEMLSGEQPFAGPNVTSILYKLVHVDPVEPANLEMHGLIPQKWREVFGRVLAKRPDDRYQTATDFVQDLEYCLGAWFGGMGETVGDAAGATISSIALGSAAEASPTAASGAPTPTPSLTPLPPPPAADVPAGGTTVTPVPPSVAAVDEEFPSTMVMSASQLASAGRPEPPPPEPVEGTIRMRPPVEGTLLVNPEELAAAGARPAPEAGATLLVPLPEQHGTPIPGRKQPGPPSRPVPDQGPTVRMPVVPPAYGEAETPPTMLVSAASVPQAVPRPEAVGKAAVARGPRKGISPLVLAGAGVAALLVLGLLGGLLLWRQAAIPSPEPTADPTAVVTPSTMPAPSVDPGATVLDITGALTVDSQPQGAAVSVDGHDAGLTPVELDELPLGRHEIKVDLRGYTSQSHDVILTAEAPRSSLNIALARAVPTLGVLEVYSSPDGATVRIDGVPVGQTPHVNHKVKLGERVVEVLKEGYEPWSAKTNLEAGKRGRVEAQLKWIAPATPTPPPVAPVDPNRVYELNEVDEQPRRLSGQMPSYPDRAPRLRGGQAVTVGVEFVVTETGAISDVKIFQSVGKIVDDAVVSAVKRWTYSPAVRNGVKVKARVPIRQTFRAR